MKSRSHRCPLPRLHLLRPQRMPRRKRRIEQVLRRERDLHPSERWGLLDLACP
ncbi:hypothetical protein Dimus_005660, partial [Dionaea muscipula]